MLPENGAHDWTAESRSTQIQPGRAITARCCVSCLSLALFLCDMFELTFSCILLLPKAAKCACLVSFWLIKIYEIRDNKQCAFGQGSIPQMARYFNKITGNFPNRVVKYSIYLFLNYLLVLVYSWFITVLEHCRVGDGSIQTNVRTLSRNNHETRF